MAKVEFKDVDFQDAKFTKFVYFHEAMFHGRASFWRATFSEGALFNQAIFSKGTTFIDATFTKGVSFVGTMFCGKAVIGENASFVRATFSKGAFFQDATFSGRADFQGATFNEGAHFVSTTFSGGANFRGVRFNAGADFQRATFSGRTIFDGRSEGTRASHIFAGTEVDFRFVDLASPDAVTFVDADLTKCKFLDTDLRKVQLVDIKWPEKDRRTAVYDETLLAESRDGSVQPWSQLERLYRELKQNHEDRRDYERAGDFHYGEKEMRRKNPYTTRGLRFFLTLYWLFSGYGERYLRPLLWAGLLFVVSTTGYMWWGLRPKDSSSILVWTNGWDWLQGAYYSFRVMTFLKPDDWVPVGYAHVMNTFQTLLSPVFLGLFALALRQRLKR